MPTRYIMALGLFVLIAQEAATEPTLPGDDAIHAITIHDLPRPDSPEYASFQAWLANHPNVRASRVTRLKISTMERGSLMMAIAGGTAPDLLRVYHHEAKAWIRNGFFERLDPYIYKDTDGDNKYTHGTDEVIWKPLLRIPDRIREEFLLEDGHFYFLPRYQWIQYMVFRKDVFRDAGVDPEKPIRTWDELLHVCRKLTDPNARIPGARLPRGRKGFGVFPNGWIWQGYLYACGGSSMVNSKTCPECTTTSEFPQGEWQWECPKCGHGLKDVEGRESARLDSDAARRGLKIWHDMVFAPFTKCPHCNEPAELGDGRTRIVPADDAEAESPTRRKLPIGLTCAHCAKPFSVERMDQVIEGCARRMVDEDRNWREAWVNGEIAMTNYHLTDWISTSNVDSTVIGVMPFPEEGGASAFHYYGIYKGSRKRPGGQKRIDICARMVLDFCEQFWMPKDDPRYLKYEKEKARQFVNRGFYNVATYDALVAAGLQEYANEIPEGSRKMQRMLHNPENYKFLPMSEGYSRVQQEILSHVLLSQLCFTRDYDFDANLKRANTLADTQVFMKDEIVQAMSRKWRLPLAGCLILLTSLAVYLLYKVMFKGRDAYGTLHERRISIMRWLGAIVLLVPAVFLICLWAYYPLVRGSVMAFEDVKVMGGSEFVGVENFIRVVSNPLFFTVMKATLIYVLAVLSLGFFVPIFLAILLNEAGRGTIVYRTIYYAPHLLGGVVVLFIWRIFYLPTEEGLFNHLLSLIGMGPVRWLQDPSINKWMLALPGIWAGSGSACLIYLAALKSIDEEMYEAADIDGAGPLLKVWSVTLPSLKPLIIINFVGAFIAAFHGMGNVLVLTGGAYETNVIGLQIFMEAFAYLRFGPATAYAWILGSMLIGFTIYQLDFLKKVEFRRAQ